MAQAVQILADNAENLQKAISKLLSVSEIACIRVRREVKGLLGLGWKKRKGKRPTHHLKYSFCVVDVVAMTMHSFTATPYTHIILPYNIIFYISIQSITLAFCKCINFVH